MTAMIHATLLANYKLNVRVVVTKLLSKKAIVVEIVIVRVLVVLHCK